MWHCKDCGHSYRPTHFDHRDGDERICKFCGGDNTAPMPYKRLPKIKALPRAQKVERKCPDCGGPWVNVGMAAYESKNYPELVSEEATGGEMHLIIEHRCKCGFFYVKNTYKRRDHDRSSC